MSTTHCRECGAPPPGYDRLRRGLRRGLCRHCYDRARAETIGRDAQEPAPDISSTVVDEPLDPNEPTREYPGTEGKVHVLELRWGAHLPLWHPQDTPVPEQADRPTELPPGLNAAARAALRPREPTLRHLSPPDAG